MSDFDKEAEREKLREKYERDKEKRQSTQRMSELLLKGATMTNRHCDQCGDPIFRYEGEEFCPTCQDAQVVGGEGAAADADGAETASAETDPAGEEPAGGEPTADAGDIEVGTPEAAGPNVDPMAGNEGQQATEPAGAGGAPEQRAPTAEAPAQVGSAAATGPPTGGDGDLGAARASLSRTVTKYAQAAENTDDPRRARELLAAAREAAEALAALND
jgi:uncharacterized Zn finger protein (UPF0148 family)